MFKRKISLILAIVLIFNFTAVFAAPRDIQRHWTGSAVNTFIENGVVSGYPEGVFKPDRYMTREEAAAVFYRLLNIVKPETITDNKSFMNYWVADVSSERWSGEAVKYLITTYGMGTDENGYFSPGNYIKKGDLAVMIYTYFADDFGYDPNNLPTFSDVSGYWANAISVVASLGILTAEADGTYCPDRYMTRGEVVYTLFSISNFELIPVTVDLPEVNVIPVPYISQVYPVYAVVGCEATSLLMGLKAKGYAKDVTLRQFLDAMPKHSSNPAKGFVGSPYVADLTKKTRTTIYPPVLTEYARAYGDVYDFSGSSLTELQAEVLDGNPVVAYCTLWWEKPFYRYYNIEGETQRLLSNNHVILVCGYDLNTNSYYIADPYNVKDTSKDYFYWIDGSVFEPIYNERRHAIVVR